MLSDVLGLMEKHHKGKEDIQSHVIPQLAKKFGNGLGLQLRSMPITMRIDKLIRNSHASWKTDLQAKCQWAL